MKTLVVAASLVAVALAPLAVAQAPAECYWHTTFREFVWWASMNTVYLEDGQPCSASIHSPGPYCTLVPRDYVWQVTFHVVLVAADCTATVSPNPECPSGGTWPNCL